MPDQPVLVVDGLAAGYDRLQVLFDVSLRAERGEAVAISAGNGAGKSTLLAAISGVLRPVLAGSVVFNGQRTEGLPCYRVARMGLVHVLERRRLAPFMTVQDNLKLSSAGVSRAERAAWAQRLARFTAEIPLLRSHAHHQAQQLSGGQQQLVAIVRGLLAAPDVLLLDEPFQGLDMRAADAVRELLTAVRDRGTTLIFTEHRDEVVGDLAHRVVHIERGRVVTRQPAATHTRERRRNGGVPTVSSIESTNDLLAIQNLYARYCFGVDSSDATLLAPCFTDDCVLIVGDNRVAEGRDDLVARFTAPAKRPVLHLTANLLIEECEGGSASCRAYFLLVDGESGAITAHGTYRDRLVRQGDAWRWSERSVTYSWRS